MHVVEPPEHSLSAALDALREAERESGASPDVEQRLRHAVLAIGAERRRARMLTFAAAAVLVLAMAWPLWRLSLGESGSSSHVAAEARREVTTEFFPLVDGNVSEMSGRIVRLELPRTALALVGVNKTGFESGGASTVLADVLVSEDGLARAVRFVGQLR
jgi:hypothetical protein